MQLQKSQKTCYNAIVTREIPQRYGRVAQLVRAHPLQAAYPLLPEVSLKNPQKIHKIFHKDVLQATAGGAL